MDGVTGYSAGRVSLDDAVTAVLRYEVPFDTRAGTLPLPGNAGRPAVGAVRVRICGRRRPRVLFRGAERNRRRGFHNLWVT